MMREQEKARSLTDDQLAEEAERVLEQIPGAWDRAIVLEILSRLR